MLLWNRLFSAKFWKCWKIGQKRFFQNPGALSSAGPISKIRSWRRLTRIRHRNWTIPFSDSLEAILIKNWGLIQERLFVRARRWYYCVSCSILLRNGVSPKFLQGWKIYQKIFSMPGGIILILVRLKKNVYTQERMSGNCLISKTRSWPLEIELAPFSDSLGTIFTKTWLELENGCSYEPADGTIAFLVQFYPGKDYFWRYFWKCICS